jgi:CBS domain-containing protein
MNQPISALMTRPAHCVDIDDSIASVERSMLHHRVSWVPVRDKDGPIVGVISSTDLLQFHAQERDPARVFAWQMCTHEPLTVGRNASIADVARQLAERNAHHVVVIDDNGEPEGVVSSLDYVRQFAAGAASLRSGAETSHQR